MHIEAATRQYRIVTIIKDPKTPIRVSFTCSLTTSAIVETT